MRGSFGKGLRKEIRTVIRKHCAQRRRTQYAGIQGVMGLPARGHVHQPGKGLRSQRTMHEPFGVPSRFASALFGLTQQAQEMRHGESVQYKRQENREKSTFFQAQR